MRKIERRRPGALQSESEMSLLTTIRRELRRHADPDRAPAMQAYMKSSMPYHGVGAIELRRICKETFKGIGLEDADTWRAEVLSLWRGAKYREELYVAVELTGDRRARGWQTMESLPMYEEMIVQGAWWDLVDALASHRLGEILRHEPGAMRKAMLAWSVDDNIWKRRSAILCQLKFKRDTDLELLYACIAPSMASKEFFLRKAIGWALRQYAWTDPVEIKRYVRSHAAELSPFTRREAMKNI